MYHYPALNSPDFQEEHARRLRRYEGMDLDEVLRQAELPICNSVGLREPVRNGVVLIENVSLFMHSVKIELEFKVTNRTDPLHRHSPGDRSILWPPRSRSPDVAVPGPHHHGAIDRQDYELLCRVPD